MSSEARLKRVARALARASDEIDPKTTKALTAYNAGSMAVEYWDYLATAAMEALSLHKADRHDA